MRVKDPSTRFLVSICHLLAPTDWTTRSYISQGVVTELHNTVVNSVLGEIENAYKPTDIILPHPEVLAILLVGEMCTVRHLHYYH